MKRGFFLELRVWKIIFHTSGEATACREAIMAVALGI